MVSYNEYLEYLKHIDNTTEQEIKTRIDGLNKDITHLKESLGKLSTVKDDLNYKLNEANNKISENFHTISIKETEITSLKNDISNYTLKLKAAKEEISKLENQKNKDEIKYIENSEQTKLLNEKYNKIQNEYEATKETVKKNFTEIQKLQSRLGIAEKNAENLNFTKIDLESRIQKYKKEIDSLSSIVENLKNSNNSDKISSLEAKISTLSKNIKQLEIDKTNLGNELTSSQEYAKQLNKSISEKNEQLKNVEPKSKVKYILGILTSVLLIGLIIVSKKLSDEKIISKLNDQRIFEQTTEKDGIISALKQSGFALLLDDIKFKTYNYSTKETTIDTVFSYNARMNIRPILKFYYYGDLKNSKIKILFNILKLDTTNGYLTLWYKDGKPNANYFEEFELKQGLNEIEFKDQVNISTSLGRYTCYFSFYNSVGMEFQPANKSYKTFSITENKTKP